MSDKEDKVDRQSSGEMSSRAAPYMNFNSDILVEMVKDEDALRNFIKDVRSMAACIVSQDETKGQGDA